MQIKPTRTIRSVAAAGLVMAVIAIAGCFIHRDTSRPVRIGYLPIYVDLPLFIAKEHGFFAKHNVDVELVRFGSSPDIGTALNTGDIDVGASIAYSVVLSSESRDPGQLKVFLVDSETPTNYLSSFVVMPRSGIKSLQDLKGKRVGSFPGPTATTFAKLVLEKAGLDPRKDLEFTEIDAGSHLSALESGTVDALFTYEPIATQAVLEKGAIKLLPGAVESTIINPWQAGVWVLRNDFMSSREPTARSIIAALYDAVDYYREHPDEAKAALAPYTSIKQSVAAATPNIPFAKIGEVDLPAFQRHADILMQRGILSKHIDSQVLLAPANWTTK